MGTTDKSSLRLASRLSTKWRTLHLCGVRFFVFGLISLHFLGLTSFRTTYAQYRVDGVVATLGNGKHRLALLSSDIDARIALFDLRNEICRDSKLPSCAPSSGPTLALLLDEGIAFLEAQKDRRLRVARRYRERAYQRLLGTALRSEAEQRLAKMGGEAAEVDAAILRHALLLRQKDETFVPTPTLDEMEKAFGSEPHPFIERSFEDAQDEFWFWYSGRLKEKYWQLERDARHAAWLVHQVSQAK